MTLSGLKNIYPYTLRGRRDKDFLKFLNIELKGRFFGGVAQLGLEQRNHNPRVGGSSPSSATKFPSNLNRLEGFFFFQKH